MEEEMGELENRAVHLRGYLLDFRHGWDGYVEEKRFGGGALVQLKPSSDDDEISCSVSQGLEQLCNDLLFLALFLRSTRWGPVIPDWTRRSITQKISAPLRNVDYKRWARVIVREGYDSINPDEFLGFIRQCLREIDELPMEEIRVVLQDLLSNYAFHVNIHDPSLGISFWAFPLVRESVGQIKDSVQDGCLSRQLFVLSSALEFLPPYLNVASSLRYYWSAADSVIDDFFIQCEHLFLRIAIRCCNFWFNRTDPETAKVEATALADMLHEIDPANPAFLHLNLRFQQALTKALAIRDEEYNAREIHLFPHFRRYLLLFDCKNFVDDELKSLVTFLLHNTLEDNSSGEDVPSFFAEIYAVFAEAAFLHREVLLNSTFSDLTDLRQYITEDLPSCSELLTKMCLLKMEFLIKQQLNSTSTSSVPFSDNRFFKADMILTSLRAFEEKLCQEGNTEYVKQSLVLFGELANEVESLHASLLSNEITNSLAKHALLQLLFKIVFFKAKSFLTELLNGIGTRISNEKDQIESLVEDLKYFQRIITNKMEGHSSDEEIVISQIEAVVRGIILFSYSFLPDNDKFNKMIFSLPQLLAKVRIVKVKLQEMSKKFPISIFPKTGFIDFLSRNLRVLLNYDPESIKLVKHHIKEVQLHLESLKSFVRKVKDSDVAMGELKDLANHITLVAYKLEYVVDSIEVNGHLQQTLQQSIWLYDLLEDIRLAREHVSLSHEMNCDSKVPQISCEVISRDTKSAVNEMVVDLGDEQNAIIDRLIRGLSQRDVVSIVGMPGIGKTTLARKVYNNLNVMYHFHRRAWCTVSQVYSKRELLLQILSDIHGLKDEIHRLTDEDLLSELRRCLLRNRYLIVMDDVWDTEAWNVLEKSFPDDSNGSRILITSRLRDVALKINPGSDPHPIRLFSDDESWILLKNKTFKGEVCPEELSNVGQQIARHCQGLPLAVVAIAGLLQKTEKRQDLWDKVSKSLSSEIINEPESQCMKILELSYNHLPEYLKACFLHLGFFLEDKDIPVSKLIRVWIAEGFIQETESKISEDVAEDYLMDLINRSLVIISIMGSHGKVKACRLHDLLRDLCLLKVKEENFFHIITRCDEPYSSFPDSDYGMDLDYDDGLPPVTFEAYRLIFYLKRNHFIDSSPSGPGTRSLLFFASADSEPRCPYDISFICHNFKLLRVLDLECINMGVSFPVEIGLMVKLRYLAVSGYIRSIPPSISNLQILETFIVLGLRGKVLLPETIWNMARLRHLHVNNHVAFRLQGLDEQVGSSFHLDNLLSFSTPSLSCGEDTMSILRRLPNLRKMRCVWYSSKNCNGFPILNLLSRLESLKMIYYGRVLNSGEFVLPLNLKKLTLSNFRLPWIHISTIGSLPNLRILKLLAGAFEGKTWDMKEEQFKELEFLEFDNLNIAKWNASCDHLPNLEQLVLRNCYDLEQIPYDFANILTLQMIHVQWCGKSVEESAKEIGDATGEIKVLISSS